MTSSLSALDSAIALTFDDVLLIPGPSDVMPGQADVTTQLTDLNAQLAAATTKEPR